MDKIILDLEDLKEVGDALKRITDNPDGGELRIIVRNVGEDKYEEVLKFTMPPLKDREVTKKPLR